MAAKKDGDKANIRQKIEIFTLFWWHIFCYCRNNDTTGPYPLPGRPWPLVPYPPRRAGPFVCPKAAREHGPRPTFPLAERQGAFDVVRTRFLSSPVLPKKSLGKINGLWVTEGGFGASEHAPWATAITLWATGNTVWATVFTVAQTVNPPLGHEKRAPEGALYIRFCKVNTNCAEMQIALFRCFSAKPCAGKHAFPIFTNRRLRRIVVPRPLTWYSELHRGAQPRYLFCRRFNRRCS